MEKLFQIGDFIAHSGLKLEWKLECDALDEDDWAVIARMLMDYQTRPFCDVTGIPRGGLPLAKALKPYASGNTTSHYALVVDDVYTTGMSFREHLDTEHLWTGISKEYSYVYKWVAFARNPPSRSSGVQALFTMPKQPDFSEVQRQNEMIEKWEGQGLS